MKILTTMMMAMCMTLSLSACESDTSENDPVIPETPQNPGGDDDDSSTTNRTAITLTVGETVLEGYLNDNRTALDLLSRLPITVTLNRGAHDYCGGISPALAYDETDVQYGCTTAIWHSGRPAMIS